MLILLPPSEGKATPSEGDPVALESLAGFEVELAPGTLDVIVPA